MKNKRAAVISLMIFSIISLPTFSFDDEACLKSAYKTTIKKAFAPMGLLEEIEETDKLVSDGPGAGSCHPWNPTVKPLREYGRTGRPHLSAYPRSGLMGETRKGGAGAAPQVRPKKKM